MILKKFGFIFLSSICPQDTEKIKLIRYIFFIYLYSRYQNPQRNRLMQFLLYLHIHRKCSMYHCDWMNLHTCHSGIGIYFSQVQKFGLPKTKICKSLILNKQAVSVGLIFVTQSTFLSSKYFQFDKQNFCMNRMTRDPN